MGETVLLEDTWHASTYNPVGSNYQNMHKAKVLNIAEFIMADNVGHV